MTTRWATSPVWRERRGQQRLQLPSLYMTGERAHRVRSPQSERQVKKGAQPLSSVPKVALGNPNIHLALSGSGEGIWRGRASNYEIPATPVIGRLDSPRGLGLQSVSALKGSRGPFLVDFSLVLSGQRGKDCL